MKRLNRVFTSKTKLLLGLLFVIIIYVFNHGFIIKMGNSKIARLEARIEKLIDESNRLKQVLLSKEDYKLQQKNRKEVQNLIQSNAKNLLNEMIPSNKFYDVLYHLKNVSKPDLNPNFLVKAFQTVRSPPRLIIGIPTIYREKHNYLIETVKSLLENIQAEEKFLIKIVVLFAELNYYEHANYIKETVDLLLLNFKEFIDEDWYPPNLMNIMPTFDDSQERMFWRTKQCLDYVYLMLYARYFYQQSDYYVQLEDDVTTVPGYTTAMLHFALTHNGWLSCDFSTLGFIGKLFRVTDLPLITDFTLLFYREKPVDWIFDQLFLVKYCHHEEGNCIKKRINGVRRIYRKPPLFQHVGHFSSLPGKTQNLREKSFKRKNQYVANITETKNPEPVKLSSNVVVYNLEESLLKLYRFGLPFIIKNATREMYISAKFEDVITAREITINFAYVMFKNTTPSYELPIEVSIQEIQPTNNDSILLKEDHHHIINSSSIYAFHHIFSSAVLISNMHIRIRKEVPKFILYTIRIS